MNTCKCLALRAMFK